MAQMDFEAVGTIYFDLAKCASPHCFAALLRENYGEDPRWHKISGDDLFGKI